MECPRCKSKKIQPISRPSDNKHYCVDCNYAWDTTQSAKEAKGTLDFSGAITAKKIFDILTKDQDLTPEFRAALETQITSIIFEQWFEGFKAGQMASILYAREFYGKNRIATGPTALEGKGRIREPEEKDSSGPRHGEKRGSSTKQRRRAEDGGIEGRNSPEIRKRIGSVELTFKRGVTVPEEIERLVAYLSQEVWPNTEWINSLRYDGKLIIEAKKLEFLGISNIEK